ncbi:MAG: hypothetical protein D3903_05970 [Candidatus Electrothrix sp. GM3_4]|nr:hypothetical protein [Candidatus Electrothrix sp. GM3_4]
MKDRPKSITIISWLLIIISVISIASTVFTYDNPEVVKMMELSGVSTTLQYILIAIGMAITISCSVLMLKAKSIGRIIYIGWTVISLLIGLFTSPAKAMMVPGLVFFVIITFFLFRPKANEYFSVNQEEIASDS